MLLPTISLYCLAISQLLQDHSLCTMSAHGTHKAELKVDGKVRGYTIGSREIRNVQLGKLMLQNIMKALGAGTGDPGEVSVRLMADEDPSKELEITVADILILAEECISSGEWATGIGPVARVALASPAAKEGAASGVSNTPQGRDYSSHWKICLRWTSDMRALLMRLPAELHADKGMIELLNPDMDSMFIIKQHVTALADTAAKVCRPAPVQIAPCRVSRHARYLRCRAGSQPPRAGTSSFGVDKGTEERSAWVRKHSASMGQPGDLS